MKRGTIKAYSLDVNAGVIICDTGETFGFFQDEWNGNVAPVTNGRVLFLGNSRVATKVSSEK